MINKIRIALFSCLAACGANSSDSEPAAGNASLSQSEPAAQSDGIRAEQVGDIWLFWHSSADHDDALLAGPAEVVDGCLRVGGHVVIWPEARLDEAKQVIVSLAAGELVQQLSVGGSEVVSVAASVRERCPAGAVWFAGD